MSTLTRAHVEPGGDAWTLGLGPARITKFSVSEMDNNVYLVTCAESGAQVLIDAADDADRIRAVIGADRSIDWVLTTHGHWDHHRALPEVTAHYGAATAAGAADAADLPVPPDRELVHGDVLEVGALQLEVIALRGHTPGSVALLLDVDGSPPVLFTGDSLFPGGPGKTAGPSEFAQLMSDLETRVFGRFGDDTVVHPGHGDSTTIGLERPNVEDWRERGW